MTVTETKSTEHKWTKASVVSSKLYPNITITTDIFLEVFCVDIL